MNKYLMLTAAAVLAGTASANAGTHSFTFATAGGTPYCDGGTVYTGRDGGIYSGAVWSWQHTNNNCASGVSTGQGILGKTTGFGKVADMSDNFEAQNYGIYSEVLNYTLPKKLKPGQPWTSWIELGGSTSFEGNSGVLANPMPGHEGTQSTLASAKSLIQAHRAARNRNVPTFHSQPGDVR
jgi:hypothetical protein